MILLPVGLVLVAQALAGLDGSHLHRRRRRRRVSGVAALTCPVDGRVVLAGLESRGFILGAPVAAELGLGMLTIRKAGKLPGHVIGVDYELEYGTARMEMHPESVHEGQHVLIIDDVLATGGTANAAVKLLRQCGASVEAVAVLLELDALGGRSVLTDVTVESALHL